MQSYRQGMITGGAIVLCALILMGNSERTKFKFSRTYKEKLIQLENRIGFIEGTIDEKFRLVGENFIEIRDETPISVSSEYTYRSVALIDRPYPNNILNQY